MYRGEGPDTIRRDYLLEFVHCGVDRFDDTPIEELQSHLKGKQEIRQVSPLNSF